jgi:autotransporter adhesin
MTLTRLAILTTSVLALGAVLPVEPAHAQHACDLNGAIAPDLTLFPGELYCGDIGSFFQQPNQTAVGEGVSIFGEGATVVGASAAGDNYGSTAVGFHADASGFGGGFSLPLPSIFSQTALGTYSAAIGLGSVAIGDQAVVGVPDLVTVPGAVLYDTVDNGTAVGTHTLVSGENGTAVGASAQATALSATAVGQNAQAIGVGSIAIGVDATANSGFATALGLDANAMASHATALGPQTDATATDSTAVGYNADATATNSVAIGANSVANQANTVSVGATGAERRIVNVAAGTAATDAVNVSQLNAISSLVTGQAAAIGALQVDVDNLFDSQRRDRKEAQRGTAAAVAMSEAPMPSRDRGISYSLHGAAYRGEYAIGGSFKYRINSAAALDVGLSHAGHKDTALRLGVSGEF